jgi:serine/threonine protein kinase
MNTGGGVRAP